MIKSCVHRELGIPTTCITDDVSVTDAKNDVRLTSARHVELLFMTSWIVLITWTCQHDSLSLLNAYQVLTSKLDTDGINHIRRRTSISKSPNLIAERLSMRRQWRSHWACNNYDGITKRTDATSCILLWWLSCFAIQVYAPSEVHGASDVEASWWQHGDIGYG